jgi:26S proteasome regulatory subunit N6
MDSFLFLLIVAQLDTTIDNEESVRIKESAILALGRVFKETKDAKGTRKKKQHIRCTLIYRSYCVCSTVQALASLIKTTRPFLGLVSRAKAAKLVRTLVDLFLDMEAGTGEEVS